MRNGITAIVTIFNSAVELLKLQHDSIESQVDNIVYIDNGSAGDVELTLFLERFSDLPNHHVIINNSNMGLGYAQNQGIKFANALGSSHVLLLDHDSVLRDGCVAELVECEFNLSNSGVNVGAVGTTYVNEATGECYPITKYCGPFIKRIKPQSDPVEATFLIASGCLISLRVIDDVGLMNEDLFVDYIDVEWCVRARSKGYSVFATPNAKMNHVIGDRRVSIFGRKISVHSPIRRYYLVRNSFYMLRCKYVPFGYKLRECVFNVLRFFVFYLISDDRSAYLNCTKKALRDGFGGVLGPMK